MLDCKVRWRGKGLEIDAVWFKGTLYGYLVEMRVGLTGEVAVGRL